LNRRHFLSYLTAASAAGILPQASYLHAASTAEEDLYDIGYVGNARILHLTDTHAQLEPVYFREPSVNIGIGEVRGQPPHLVGGALLNHFGIAPGTRGAYAFTSLNFQEAAARYGRMGGFAQLKTLVDRLRTAVGQQNCILIDGGDLWQGSGLAQAMQGSDMVETANLLGIEATTGHWEFTYGEKIFRQNLEHFQGDFLAQNVFLTEEAAFDGAPAFDFTSGRVFKPATIREIGDRRIGIIGQAMPYGSVTHPKRFTPDWTFGIHDAELQKVVDGLRERDKVDAVVLLSHNGMDIDTKLASRVSGIDVILGGHTHDAVPQPNLVANSGGRTLVTNAGSNGKFVAVVDLDLGKGTVKNVRYSLLPIYTDLLKPDRDMQRLIDRLHAPYAAKFGEQLATAGELLYRRGNFTGPMDQIICDALRHELDAQIALSPGFRWGVTILAGQPITMRDLLSETAITFPEVYVTDMSGSQIKDVMEDVADNLFSRDPYYRRGGDMVRVGGMDYVCAPTEAAGHRISDMTLNDGRPIEADKQYRVAAWASVNPQNGKPVSDVVASYLRAEKTVQIKRPNRIMLKGVSGNLGIAEGS
jgi:sulfur-oxidizing protein SoxB